jgi:hypothetical protein
MVNPEAAAAIDRAVPEVRTGRSAGSFRTVRPPAERAVAPQPLMGVQKGLIVVGRGSASSTMRPRPTDDSEDADRLCPHPVWVIRPVRGGPLVDRLIRPPPPVPVPLDTIVPGPDLGGPEGSRRNHVEKVGRAGVREHTRYSFPTASGLMR